MNTHEKLAKQWMLGERQTYGHAPPRKAWEHPEDLVRLIDVWIASKPWNPNLAIYLKSVAWLHDIIEDGVKEDGTPVTAADLLAEGVERAVILDVVALTHNPAEEKVAYLARLHTASWCARVVKCIDRICNLREGKDVFKLARWVRYTEETQKYVLPLANNLDGWFVDELQKALDARPVT